MRRVRWSYANSGLALTLRRWRGRFGLSARRVAVRTHVPWYWRALATVITLAVALSLAGWIYDAGRRFGGFDRSESEQELRDLRAQIATLQSDLERQRSLADAGESSLQIERTTAQQLSLQVKRLELDNARLREDLALFEGLAQSEGGNQKVVTIHRLRVEADAAGMGRYRYRMLVAAPGGKHEQEFNGRLQLTVTMQQAGKVVMMSLPRADAAESAEFRVVFKHFRRIEGVFQVPSGAVVKAVEASMLQGGTTIATQSAVL
jgi:hypothetical protein